MRIRYLFFILFTSLAFSQQEASVWYFGENAGIKFHADGNISALTNGQLNTFEGCATISDIDGELLFYTDGVTIWNKNHQIMQNGGGLMGDYDSTQSATIVQKPGSLNLYYVFTLDNRAGPDGFRYSVVDISLNGGLGDVTAEKNILVYAPSDEKISIVKHANNVDFWVVTHGWNSNSFYSYSLSSTGFNAVPVISNSGQVINGSGDNTWGYMKISPDGSKLGISHSLLSVELMNFDNATGIVSNAQTIFNGVSSYGVEFSPDSHLLYISVTDPQPFKIIQYDLSATSVSGSAQIIYNGPIVPTALQLGPNGKIYIGEYHGYKLGVINDPNVIGSGCNIQMNAIDLAGRECFFGLPPFVSSFFNATFTAENLCLGDQTQFTLSSTQSVTNTLWNFGDNLSSSQTNPAHQYAAAGNYNVTVQVTTPTGISIKSKQIAIASLPVIANTVNNQVICGTANMNYDLSQFSPILLGSQSAAVFGISYFSNSQDANNNNNVLSVNYTLPLGATNIYARIYNLTNPVCFALTNFSVTLYAQPIANQPSDYVICESQPYDNTEQFDLSTKTAQILGNQNASIFTVSYHDSQVKADNSTDVLPLLYYNTSLQETIFARIQNINNPGCYSVTSFLIKVVQQPIITQVTDYAKCDDVLNDGTEIFDLSQKTTEILNGQSASIFEVKYYLNQSDAVSGINNVIIPVNNTSNNQTIYYSIAAVGNSNCKAIGSFKLIVNQLPKANNAPDIMQCDDVLNDGKAFFTLNQNTAVILGLQSPTQFTVTYHLNQNDADSGGAPLQSNYLNVTNPQTIYARVQNIDNHSCFATTSFELSVSKMPIANTPNDIFTCDNDLNDGFESFDLSQQNQAIFNSQSDSDFAVSYYLTSTEAAAGTGALSNNFINTANGQTIYARIANKLNSYCFDITDFHLNVYEKPELSFEENYSICEGKSIIITAPAGFDTYAWSNGASAASTRITQAGNYSLTVIKHYPELDCETTQNITVHNSNAAEITRIDTEDWSDSENTILVHVTGDGDYEYSTDSINFQDSPQFSGLSSGAYQIFVRDKLGCGTVTKEVFLLMYPRFFTPNGDGYNDYWKIKFSSLEPDMKLLIFDRYGKLLLEDGANDFGWDGKLNGNLLPSDDYWFVVRREDGKEYKGHFSLKR